ncbi:cytochrome c [Echinicola sp. CAU 1574]|uniref:Cytochrome c n=1 Tax=Echinicola arenosa TaxID=2774144 RepID=A0ABR9ARN2_9BACT|nr:cytochrome c [Echinicola arenosa]MBD8490533.1 cytochrome c [Echinicola arenosa]
MIKLGILSCFIFSYLGWTAFYFQDQDEALKASIKRGQEVYQDYCISCHLANGEGVDGTFPPLAKSDFLLKKREESIRAVKYGMNGEIIVNKKTYNSTMTNLGLYDDEVADVMNYILNSWGNKSKKMVTEEEVKAVSKEGKKDS